MHRHAQTSIWDVSAFHWWTGAVCLKALMYSHFNCHTNCRTMPHRRCVSIIVLAFSAVLPYFVWKHRCFLIPINTATATATACPQSVNIPWKSGKWVLFRGSKYLVHTCSFTWTYCEHLGIEYYPESRTVLFTFTTVNIPWSCSWGNNGYHSNIRKKSAFKYSF